MLSPQALHVLDTIISRPEHELTLNNLAELSKLEEAVDVDSELFETIAGELDRTESAIFHSLSSMSTGFATPTEFSRYLAQVCARISKVVGQSPVIVSHVVANQLEEVVRYGDPFTCHPTLNPGSPEAVSIVEKRPASTFDTRAEQAIGLEPPYLVIPILDNKSVVALLHCRISEDILRPATAYLSMVAQIIATAWSCIALENELGEHISDIRSEFEEAVADAMAVSTPSRALIATLTAREIDVLHHVRNGASNADIATALFISVETVKSHVKNILRKTSATNRAELIGRDRAAHFSGGN